MDLTGQLCNLSTKLRNLLEMPLKKSGSPREYANRPLSQIFPRRRYELIRDALIHEMANEGSDLRLMEIRQRVEGRLGEPIAPKRFKDYVNDQSRGAKPLLERTCHGRYRLRS